MSRKDRKIEVPEPCDKDVFTSGKPLMAANTWYPEDNPIRADGFEKWVQKIAKESGQKVDWHYSGGIAQVLYLGDKDKILEACEKFPCPAQVMRWFETADPGLYRNGVTPTPENAIGAFYEGGRGSTFMVEDEN
jgi:hypothetical protein